MMRIIIFGYGKTGRALTRWFLQKKMPVIVIDRTKISSKDFLSMQEDEPFDFSKEDQLIVSPGIPMHHSKIQEAQNAGVKIFGEMEFVLSQVSNRMIGVTGTNGKTSVTTWITQILNHANIPAISVGNIGTPVSELLLHPQPEKILVIEISSFQLQTLHTPCFDMGVILNLAENHLDHHKSYDEYVNAKLNIDKCVKKEGKLFVSEDIVLHFSDRLSMNVESYEKITFPKDWMDHWKKNGFSVQNIQATYCLIKEFGITPEEFFALSKDLQKLPHRLELIFEKNQICFYNDSKATNVASVMHALEYFSQSVILIAGGKDKNGSYEPWRHAFKNKVKKVLLVGQAQEKIFQVLFTEYDVEKVSTLNQAVAIAWRIAKPKDTILFSPGCSSYDQFKNFEDRGERFKESVFTVAK